MDAVVGMWITIIVGAFLAFLVGALFAEKGNKPEAGALALTIFFGGSVFAVVFQAEEIRGTPTEIEIGSAYTYHFSPDHVGIQTIPLIDQDGERAFYEISCKRIRGGCEALPADQFFRLIPGKNGNDLVVIPLGPSNPSKNKDDVVSEP